MGGIAGREASLTRWAVCVFVCLHARTKALRESTQHERDRQNSGANECESAADEGSTAGEGAITVAASAVQVPMAVLVGVWLGVIPFCKFALRADRLEMLRTFREKGPESRGTRG